MEDPALHDGGLPCRFIVDLNTVLTVTLALIIKGSEGHGVKIATIRRFGRMQFLPHFPSCVLFSLFCRNWKPTESKQVQRFTLSAAYYV